jgi:hypothetical protein
MLSYRRRLISFESVTTDPGTTSQGEYHREVARVPRSEGNFDHLNAKQ